ncbi:OsmC family protein [Massilia sp. Dwa41.01b]|uniref:OsmC family protein n=1 Tax=unclassified Massilia TaxID=2609279 RepID=UPI001600F870|nr:MULTISPECIES: OsmC family protein [unclassified Massilia]QNA88536.1 OsmC family protein [Massilia sp. Dwa41.01b]QNA99435.1 OsmC family protein [Massilia sp. Se16.2.3]
MEIVARVCSSPTTHEVTVGSDGASRPFPVPGKTGGGGSALNGGEFLMLALATCYCNDLYREARRLGIPIDVVEVTATAEFPGIGLAATNIRYHATVRTSAPAAGIARLLSETDAVAEVHNTLRAGVAVTMAWQLPE